MKIFDKLDLRWEADPIFFMHVPKTAGTSLRSMLHHAYASHDTVVLEYYLLHRYPLASLGRFRCYISQCGPNLPALLGRPELPVVTLLRDPVERAISLLYFHQDNLARHPNWFQPDYYERYKRLVGLDLRTLLADPDVCSLVADNQTRILGLLKDFRPLLADGEIGRQGHPLRAPFQTPVLDDSMDAALARACRWLDEMAVVGLTERFSESAAMICDLVGMPQHRRIPRERLGVQKQDVAVHGYRVTTSPDLIAQIESLTRRDQALYAHAVNLFETQWMRH